MQINSTLVLRSSLACLSLGAALLLSPPLSAKPPKPEPTPEPESLRKRKIPEPSKLKEFVRDKDAAIILGKALFWDMQVGSDGKTSCATCHFNAGADRRIKNQISPGLDRVNSYGEPDPDKTFQVGGPNYTLKASDFPFHKLSNVNDRKSSVISDANDVASSQGVILEKFLGLSNPGRNDVRQVIPDDTFKVGDLNTRRVEPRNTPTVINAVFNRRNFWDGRAQESFNGVNPFGLRDEGAYIWKADKPDKLKRVSIDLDNASLASQAVGPPLSNFEMSADGRTFPDLGRKLLNRRPLSVQRVHREDGVLGSYSRSPQPGMTVDTYAELIRSAFKPEWWQGQGLMSAAGTTSEDQNHMEANFSLFFGLAIQLYEATLVSDHTPFDAYAEGNHSALTEQQKRGLDLFFGSAKCSNCHGDAEFTKATVNHIEKDLMERMIMGDGCEAIYDNAFYNIGVRPTREDLGVGGKDPFGRPLSESRLAQQVDEKTFKELIGGNPI